MTAGKIDWLCLENRHFLVLDELSCGYKPDYIAAKIPSVKCEGENLRGGAAIKYLIQQIFDRTKVRNSVILVVAALKDGHIAGPVIANYPRFSELEAQVVELLIQGLSNAEIVEAVKKSLPAVKDLVYQACKKYQAKNRVELAAKVTKMTM